MLFYVIRYKIMNKIIKMLNYDVCLRMQCMHICVRACVCNFILYNIFN